MSKKNGGRKGPRVGGLRGVLEGLTGARLCYGEPVTAGMRTVIPVAKVRVAGGGGWGGDAYDGGGGGGGLIEAAPIGFIEFDDSGSRYHEIPDPDRFGRRLKAAAAAFATLTTAVAGAKALKATSKPQLRRRRRRGLLGR